MHYLVENGACLKNFKNSYQKDAEWEAGKSRPPSIGRKSKGAKETLLFSGSAINPEVMFIQWQNKICRMIHLLELLFRDKILQSETLGRFPPEQPRRCSSLSPIWRLDKLTHEPFTPFPCTGIPDPTRQLKTQKLQFWESLHKPNMVTCIYLIFYGGKYNKLNNQTNKPPKNLTLSQLGQD